MDWVRNFLCIKIGFNDSDIVKIASNDGGSKNLQAVIELQPQLIKIGFTDSDIVNIASNIGGSKTLEYIVENKNKLKNKDLEYITKKLSRNGGSGILKGILEEVEA